MRIIAVIPARGGSVGLPGKNLRPFNNVPLVGRTILTAKASRYISEVYVSSDSDEILDVARKFGALPIKRPAGISDSTASSEAALTHALMTLDRENTISPEVLVFLQCTSPFTTSEDIDKVLAPVIDGGADSAFSAIEDHGFIWQFDSTGFAKGITHDHTKPRQRRQDMTPRFRENGAVYVMKTSSFLASGTRFCGNTTFVPVNGPHIEIDTEKDWEIAEVYATLHDRINMQRVGSIKALVTDFDGVHTDDSVFVDQDGTESVRCSRSDGMGLELLRNAGLRLLILSREQNAVVKARANKLRMEAMYHIHDKLPALGKWRLENALEWSEIAYIGNDINDVECMKACGSSFAPSDAHQSAKEVAHMVLSRPGGNGALRELSDYLLTNRLVG
ncbi:acylneuraminate cytidylyltransferase [Agrobacterium arsenijevicii]|uniref:N-acylneuraminate cytidylyltransferase n=1 Tax=Agrobacterium arsenijevicii TaxID=1585697 RepID=A0ABR5D4C4_9HYPH|nr:hypothetical protein RP75_17850 [Agrobacterium arsenijevicii]